MRDKGTQPLRGEQQHSPASHPLAIPARPPHPALKGKPSWKEEEAAVAAPGARAEPLPGLLTLRSVQHCAIVCVRGLLNVSSTDPDTFPEDGQADEGPAAGQAGLVRRGWAAHVGMKRGRVGTPSARLFGQAAFSISKPFFPLWLQPLTKTGKQVFTGWAKPLLPRWPERHRCCVLQANRGVSFKGFPGAGAGLWKGRVALAVGNGRCQGLAAAGKVNPGLASGA